MKLSAVVLTKNNQTTLKRCLSSLTWCQEIIIIDDFSTDQTRKISRQFEVKFVTHVLKHDWSRQRNFALTQTKNDWVLFIDSDEVISPALKKEILKLDFAVNGYFLPRTDIFLGQKLEHGETAKVRLLRLANKKQGRWIRPVHEVWDIKGKTSILTHPILHQRNLSLFDFIERINVYTSLETQSFHWLDLFKPVLKFILNYFFHGGYKDKMQGFIMAYLMSLHSLIVRVKSWKKNS